MWPNLALALVAFGVVGLFWVLVFGRTQDKPPHPTDDRPGDDDQFRRLRSFAPHIRRQANAETAAEEGSDA